VYNGAGTRRAFSTVEYDNYGIDTNHAGLLSRANASGFDASFSAGYLTRGNVTATTQHLLNDSGSSVGSVSSYAQYDILGNVVRAIDGRGYATEFDFSDRFGTPDNEAEANDGQTDLGTNTSYAFAGKITNAAAQIVFTQFDYSTG